MKLLDALTLVIKDVTAIPHARMATFAFAESEMAFVAEMELEELVPLLEAWCVEQRKVIGTIQ